MSAIYLPGSRAPRVSFAAKREIVRWRREAAEMEAQGYRRHETDWEILRGGRFDEVIVDAKVSQCGKYVYTKLGPKTTTKAPAVSDEGQVNAKSVEG